MSKDRSTTSSSNKRPESDDFKSITGIGPAVEKRLKNIGIFTFAQLAALSPADIAAAVIGISGLTTERIIKQNWTGQAHALVRQSIESKSGPAKPENQFSADVLVIGQKDGGRVSKEIQHPIKETDDSEDIVVPLQEKEIFNFVTEETPPRHPIISPQPVSELRVQELKVVEEGTDFRRKTLQYLQPFDVQFTVILIGPANVTVNPLEYSVYIYAKRLEDRTRHKLAEAHGIISLNEIVTIIATGKSIPQGTYHLWANVMLPSIDKTTRQSFSSSFHEKPGMLLIY